MSNNKYIRLYNSSSLNDKAIILSNSFDIHYLIKVMRKKIDDEIIIFNEIDGEYLAKIINITNKNIHLETVKQTRKAEEENQINLIFAPIKQHRMMFMLEKATELGVTSLIPVITKHTIIDKINIDKWQIYVKEAAEQCNRLSVPSIKPLLKLNKFLETWDSQKIYFCNEQETGSYFGDLQKSSSINILIGPEGGFADDEIKLLSSLDYIHSVHLGDLILRAETATITALVLAKLNCQQ